MYNEVDTNYYSCNFYCTSLCALPSISLTSCVLYLHVTEHTGCTTYVSYVFVAITFGLLVSGSFGILRVFVESSTTHWYVCTHSWLVVHMLLGVGGYRKVYIVCSGCLCVYTRFKYTD